MDPVHDTQTALVNVCRLRAKGGSTEIVVDPLTIFHQALENSKPIMGTIGIRRGGKLYQVCFTSLSDKVVMICSLKGSLSTALKTKTVSSLKVDNPSC